MSHPTPSCPDAVDNTAPGPGQAVHHKGRPGSVCLPLRGLKPREMNTNAVGPHGAGRSAATDHGDTAGMGMERLPDRSRGELRRAGRRDARQGSGCGGHGWTSGLRRFQSAIALTGFSRHRVAMPHDDLPQMTWCCFRSRVALSPRGCKNAGCPQNGHGKRSALQFSGVVMRPPSAQRARADRR